MALAAVEARIRQSGFKSQRDDLVTLPRSANAFHSSYEYELS